MSTKIDYFYSRRRDSHYNTSFHILMEKKPKGYQYLNLLDKFIQLSLPEKGRLVQPSGEPYDVDMLSALTRHDIATVKEGLEIFKANKQIDIMPNGTIYMLDIQDMIGKSSTEADRKRKYRAKMDAERVGKPLDGFDDDEEDKRPPKNSDNEPQNPTHNPTQGKNHTHIMSDNGTREGSANSQSVCSSDGNGANGTTQSTPAFLQYTDAFEQLWDAFPRKDGKQEAYRAYISAKNDGVDDCDIADGIERYIEYLDEQDNGYTYATKGGKWFRDRGWEDTYYD